MLYNFQEGAPDSGWADRDRLNSFAFTLNMNMDEFNDCMDSSKYKIRVKANYNEAVKQGAQATPNIYYNFTKWYNGKAFRCTAIFCFCCNDRINALN